MKKKKWIPYAIAGGLVGVFLLLKPKKKESSSSTIAPFHGGAKLKDLAINTPTAQVQARKDF